MRQTLDRTAIFFPWLGLLLIVAGAVVYFFTRRWDLAPNLLLIGGALLLLLFAVIRPNDVRRMVSGRQARYGTSTVLSVLFFFAIAILVYYIAYQNNDWRYDATETGEFTPLPETVQLLEGLEEPIHVLGFYTFQTAAQQEQARTQLQSLQAYTDKLTYEFVDPEENPVLAQQYDLTFDGTLVFTKGEGEDQVFSKSSSLSDRDIHVALVRVVNPVEKNLYFITGHGEPDIEDFAPEGLGTAAQLLEESGFTVETLNLFVEGEVPQDATVIALVDQRAPMAPEEVAAIRDYLGNGGAAFIARDAIDNEARARVEEDDLNEVLDSDWGLVLRQDVIIEQVFAQAGQSFGFSFIGANYGSSPITRDLEEFGTVYDVARSVGSRNAEGVTTVDLVTTSNEAWGETDFEALSQGIAEPDPEEDTMGPLAVGLNAERTETGARLVVFGDADFISNQLITSGGNNLLLTNAFNWLADDEVAVELTPRESVDRTVTISQSQLGLLQVMSICLGPLLMGLIGFGVWYSRRQRR